jgi:hypothetical protein
MDSGILYFIKGTKGSQTVFLKKGKDGKLSEATLWEVFTSGQAFVNKEEAEILCHQLNQSPIWRYEVEQYQFNFQKI